MSQNDDRQKYVLFDVDLLIDSTSNYQVKRTFSTITHKKKVFSDQTIYNLLFHNSSHQQGRNVNLYSSFKEAMYDSKKLPYDILITITPLSKENHNVIDITDRVLKKQIKFIENDSLLLRSTKDLFFGIHAPLGIFDYTPDISLKRTDYRVVLKKKKKYYLVDETTLTELYIIKRGGNYFPSEYDCCSIYIFGEPFPKGTKVTDFGERFLSYPARLDGKIFLEKRHSLGHTEALEPFVLADYWTNGSRIKGTKNSINDPLSSEIFLHDGIGNFQYLSNFGIVNGNYLDYFYGPKNAYSVDKKRPQIFELEFDIVSINGLPYSTFIEANKTDDSISDI